MKLHNEEMKQVKSELEKPALNQAQNKFRPEDRFAIILANEFYSKKYIGMIDLPETKDDLRNIL